MGGRNGPASLCAFTSRSRTGEEQVLIALTDSVWEGNILTISIKCKERREEGEEIKFSVSLSKLRLVVGLAGSELFLQKITHLGSCIYLLLTPRKFIDPKIYIEKIF